MLDIAQGSPEWHALRVGKVTASRVADVVTRTKTGWAASRANYMAELVVERLTGSAAEGFTTPAMQWGIDTEPEARLAYEVFTNATVHLASFVPHHSIANAGASPDGFVGDDGLVETKCPNTATHIETLLGQTVPARYITQMLWQMACTGRQWCDFVSFDPRLPDSMQLYIERVKRDDDRIAELEAAVADFLSELEMKVAALRQRYEGTNDNAELLKNKLAQSVLAG